MNAVVTLKKGMMITFKYKVDAASGDNFLFKFDGRTVLTAGATDGYTSFEYSVPSSGEHQLSFVFKKNASGSSGADCAYVKYFASYHTFESAVNGSDDFLPFDNETDYPWYAFHDYVGSSNWGEDNSSSYFTLTLPMQAGETLSFRYRSSSESNYDYFRFFVDGTQQVQTSGNTNWANYTFTASSTKTYTFKWAFEKDYSADNYDDAAYVDDVVYSGHYAVADGDADGDGSVNSADALLVMRYVMGLVGPDALDLDRCDMNGDGVVDSVDATIIMRMAMGM